MPGKMPEAYKGDRPYIMISYARADGKAAQTIMCALDSAGYRVWYDRGIEAGSPFPDHIADRIHDCACVVMLFSKSSVSSKWCRDEVGYALDLEKDILPIYLEDVELPRSLQMRLGEVQALFWHKYDSDDEFNEALFAVQMLDSCLTEEGKESRGVKPRRDEASEAGVVADRESGADGDSSVKPNHPAEEDGDEQEGKSRRRFLKDAAEYVVIILGGILFGLLLRAAISYVWYQDNTDESTTGVAVESESVQVESVVEAEAKLVAGVPVRDKLDDYKWGELKTLSRAIAEERYNVGWMEIAKEYHLVDEDGKLQGDEKVFTLDDGTKTSIRILGFRHDELAGGGRAGITFEFANAPVTHRMNEDETNEGGWEKSEMREWLNSEFLGRFPPELQSRIETVRKQTNNVGAVESEDDTSVVTPKEDKLWLLSVSEVYGHVDLWSSASYDAEGSQYKLYADQGVTAKTYDFCKKDGVGLWADSWWWLRSPYANGANRFRLVYDDGGWHYDHADGEWGVSPGFCF